MSVPRYMKDGKVAVLVSPGFGGGWSTWAYGYKEEFALHRSLVEFFLGDSLDSLESIVEKISGISADSDEFPLWDSAAEQVRVQWLDPGIRFEIREYDGSESIYTLEEMNLFEA